MKFGSVFLSLVCSLSYVLGEDVQLKNEEPTSINFSVDYTIQEFPNVTYTDVIELHNGENIHLEYKVANNEDDDISVIGVGGILVDPATNQVKANLSSGAVGPIVLSTGESKTFVQDIPLNLVPDHYLLSPQVYIVFEDQIKMVPVRGQLATISDLPISWFNPQLLFLELVLLATLAGAGYVAFQIWGKQYLKPAPVQVKAKKVQEPTAAATGGKAYDSSWIPEHHLQKKKKAN